MLSGGRRRLIAIVVGAFLLVPTVARAEAPPNDRPADAMPATPLPFRHTADFTEATGSTDEPPPCWDPRAQVDLELGGEEGGQTLWYRYDATEEIGLLASGYRYVNENGYLDLGAYRVTPSGLELVGCVSSDPYWPWTPDIFIHARASETYLFMMSMLTYPDDTLAMFALDEAPHADASVESLEMLPVTHQTDAGPVATGEEFDASFEVGLDLDWGYRYVSWALEICPRALAPEAERCTTTTGSALVWNEPRRVTYRVNAPGAGDFTAQVSVQPIGYLDVDGSNDHAEADFSVLVEGLGFGIG